MARFKKKKSKPETERETPKEQETRIIKTEATARVSGTLGTEAELTFTGTIIVPRLVWISKRDNRVCPICQELDGRAYPADDPALPRPVVDSHDGCRCRLLPYQKDGAYDP